MNPSSVENQSGFEVPLQPAHEADETGVDTRSEKSIVSSPENSPQSQTAQASAQVATALAAGDQPAASVVISDDTATPLITQTTHTEPEDKELEKQSVEKAKTIISQTKDDPFVQNQQLNQFKAQYIQKRFKTTIKTDDALTK